MSEQKKTYVAPKLTEYGKVEKETKGNGGADWEVYGSQTSTDEPA